MSEINISVNKDLTNKLMDRRELDCIVTYAEKTPSRQEIKDAFVSKFALNPETTVVIKINQSFGSRASKVLVYSYASKEAMRNVAKYLVERGTKKKEKKEAGQEAKAGPAAAQEATSSGNAADAEAKE